VDDIDDAELAALIRSEFLNRARADDSAAAVICDFPGSEMERPDDSPSFAEWREQNEHRIRPGGEAFRAAEEIAQFCREWLRKTRHTRSD